MKKAPGSGALFPKAAHSRFLEITGQRYDAMAKRLARKKIELPFTKDELRADVLKVCGGEDGFFHCRYCNGLFDLADIAIDHAIPLARGGEPGLGNLDYPCKADNDAKGKMRPGEYMALLAFLKSAIPLARQDVLARLRMAVSLAAGNRANADVIDALRKSGHWQAAQARRRTKKKAAGNG